MRWPFGPPHLTLKPSKKNKNKNKTKKTNQKNTDRNNNIQAQNKTKPKKKPNQHQKQDQKQKTLKHTNLPNPNKEEEANPKKPKKLGKTSIFSTFMVDTQKQTTINIKPQKKENQKHNFPCSKTTHYFHKFSVFFFIIQFLFLKSCVLLKTL